jgi:hypothetical protein
MGVYYFECGIDGGFEKEHSSGDPRNPCPLCRIAELEAENKALREAAEKLLSPVIREALAAHESQRRILNPANRLNTHVVLYLEDLYILQAALEGGDD